MPMLWGDAVIGWANIAMATGRIQATTGYARRCAASQAFRRALNAELERMKCFFTDYGRDPVHVFTQALQVRIGTGRSLAIVQ